MKSVLIGNGINSRLRIEQLKTERINSRFIMNAKRYVPLLSSVFSKQINEKNINDLFAKTSPNENIEKLARTLYDYIRTVSTSACEIWSDNAEHRLQDIITCISITSIFFDDSGLIQPSVNKSLLPNLSRYEKVFSLNYYEFWDYNRKCIYLHGRIDYNMLENKTDAFLYNYKRMNLQEYREGIDRMKLNGKAVAFDSSKYVLAPEGLDKSRLTCIAGIFPSDKLFPAQDLYMVTPKILYEELKSVTDLDIFGVSPYGDNDLISVINNMSQVTIYIHEIDRNTDKDEWENKLKNCPHKFTDALDLR